MSSRLRPRPLERVHVMVGDVAPDHLSAQHVGLLAHGVAARLIVEKRADFPSQGGRVTERHQHSPPVGQQLLGVPVRRGDDALAATKCIGQGPRGDLRGVEIRRDVDVGHADEFEQFVDLDEAVVEAYVGLDTQGLGQPLQADPVTLTLLSDQVGMGRPEHDVNEVGKFLEDRRHRAEHVLDPLVRGEQPERQRDVLALDPELVLVEGGIDERHVRNAVGNQVNLDLGNVVGLLQEGAGPLGHHDHPGRQVDDLVQHPALIAVGLLEHGVQRW